MQIPSEIRDAFRRYGRAGGLTRAARMSRERRSAVARRAAMTRWIRQRFGAGSFAALGLPGGDVVDAGLTDLANGEVTVESLVVSLAAPRLRREGVPVGAPVAAPEQRLYRLLSRSSGDLAHARYGAWLRQIASFADACRLARHDRDLHASREPVNISPVGRVASARPTRFARRCPPAGRSRDAGDAFASSRSGDAAAGPTPPQSEGRQGIAGRLRRRSSVTYRGYAPSSLLAYDPQAPGARPTGDMFTGSGLTRERLRDLMREIARTAPRRRAYPVYFVGGATAIVADWRDSTIDADLHSDQEEVFRDIQGIKERLQLNVEFARPEQFVPALAGSEDRHVFIDTMDEVSFYHYDPYAQLLSKVVRGFRRDLEDAENFLASGMVDARLFQTLVSAIPATEYAKYPALSRQAVLEAVEDFLARAVRR